MRTTKKAMTAAGLKALTHSRQTHDIKPVNAYLS